MGFLSWHYNFGINYYVKRYIYSLNWVVHYFSLPLLLPTLFAPWKKLIDVDKKPGFDFQRWFQTFTYNAISRFIGATVRIVLFLVGIYSLVIVFVLGALGLIVWTLIPFFSYSLYQKFSKSPQQISEKIVSEVNNDPNQALNIIFNSEPGKFLLAHLGLNLQQMLSAATPTHEKLKPVKNFHTIIKQILDSKIISEEKINSLGIKKADLLAAAQWWDKRASEQSKIDDNPGFGRAGIGVELLFGYTPNLNNYSEDMSLTQDFSHHLIGRGDLVSRMERVLGSGKNVFLIGPPGVGKKTIVYEFARRASIGELGSKMAYNKVLELESNLLISESIDLNQKKVKVKQILAEAANAGNIILMIKDLHRITNQSVEGFDFTDVFEKYLEEGKIKIIAILTEHEYERFMSPNLRLRKFFETVEATQPSKEEALEITFDAALAWENSKGIITTVPAIRQILDGSDRYITETPFPEKALELLDSAVSYCLKNNLKTINTDTVREILAEKTGISLARLSESEKSKLGNLEDIIHQRLVSQETAVNMIAKILRSKTTGVVDSSRPLGSFMFLGPTGVGKTETAKVLAKVYYGSSENILRFDMAEYSGHEGLERLIGSVSNNQPGSLTTAIKNHPASLLLLDEIEKAPPAIFNLFLTMLDEGYINDAFDRKINCSHLFIVATTNAGSQFIRQQVQKGITGEELQKQVLDHVMSEHLFSPEFINRFDGTIVYEPLDQDNLIKVAKILLENLQENLKAKNIYAQFDDSVAEKVAQDGYELEFGARPMRRVIELQLGDIIGKAILSGSIKEGDKIKVTAPQNQGYKVDKIN